jgi:hypothetical protein
MKKKDEQIIEVEPLVDDVDSKDELASLSLSAFIAVESDSTLTDVEKGLGPRRLKFVQEFIKSGGKAEDSAVKAGYQPSFAVQLLKQDLVKKAIQQRLNRRGIAQAIDQDWIINKYARIAEVCSKEVSELDKRGNIVGVKIQDAANALKALKDLGTLIGVFNDKLEIGGTDKPIQIERKDIIVDISNIASKLASKVITQKNIEG